MVALELQRDLIAELKHLLGEMVFKTPKGAMSKLHIYEQNLPIRTTQRAPSVNRLPEEEFGEDELNEEELDEETLDEELEEQFPYCIVKLDVGKSDDAQAAHIISTKLIFGVYDDALDASGYKDILNMMEDIRRRFRTNPILNNRYAVQDEISWALPDEDAETFPYFFGAMYLDWQAAEYRREDDFA